LTSAFTDLDDTLDAPIGEPELDRAALERLWPADEWLARVGTTREERAGLVPRAREPGPRGRRSALTADALACELTPTES